MLERLTALVAAAPVDPTTEAEGDAPRQTIGDVIDVYNYHAERTPAQKSKLAKSGAKGARIWIGLPDIVNRTPATGRSKSVQLALRPVVTLEVIGTLAKGFSSPLDIVEAIIYGTEGGAVEEPSDSLRPCWTTVHFERCDVTGIGADRENPDGVELYVMQFSLVAGVPQLAT